MKLNLKTELDSNEEVVWTGEQDKNAVNSEFRTTLTRNGLILILLLLLVIRSYTRSITSLILIIFSIRFTLLKFSDIKFYLKKKKRNSDKIFIVTNKRVILANTNGDIIKEYSKEKIDTINLISNNSTYSVIFNVELEEESIAFEDIKDGNQLYSIIQKYENEDFDNNIMIENEHVLWEEKPAVNIIREKYTTAFISIMVVFTVGLIIILFHLNSQSATSGIIIFISIMIYSTYVYISSVKEINKYKNIRYIITNRRMMCITNNNDIAASADLNIINEVGYTTSRFNYGLVYCNIQCDFPQMYFNYLIDYNTPITLLENHMNCVS